MSARPMGSRPVRLAPIQRLSLYGSAGLLLLSGVGWLAARYLGESPGRFDGDLQALEPWCLRIHGAAAMAALLAVGSLLPGHIAQAWRLRRNLRSGLPMLVMLALLVPTAYGLYYAGGEESRDWLSLLHWSIGLMAAVCLPLHVWLGARRPRRG